MARIVNERSVYEHLEVIEVLCKRLSSRTDSEENERKAFAYMNREIGCLLGKCYFESGETVEHLEDMICDILDQPQEFGSSEAIYQIYASILGTLVEIKNDNYLRDKKVAVR